MIHHCDIISTPRRVTSIPAIPDGRHAAPPRAWIGIAAALGLLLSVAASLHAQGSSRQAPAAADSAAPARRMINWTSDRRSYQVGDILKVVIDEYALAQANKDNVNSASRKRNMAVGINPPSLPGSASPIGNINGSVGTGDAGESTQHGTATRDTRYVGEIPVRVVAVTKEGLLEVKGSKTIDVDKNKQVLTLSGFIRPLDVNASDMVRSNAVADAQLSYQSKGSLGKPKNGIVSKILGIFWP